MNNGPSEVLKWTAGGIILGIAGAILLFAWRVTEHLTEMSTGIILGIGMTALVVGLILLPLTFLLVRSRQADMYEFLASQSRAKAPNFDVSLLPPAPQEPPAFGGRMGGFTLLGDVHSFKQNESDF